MDRAPSLLSRTQNSVVKRVTRLVKAVIRGENDKSDGRSKWTESYKGLLTIKKALDDRAKQPGARVYEFRMLDLVIGNETPTRSKVEKLLDATGMSEDDREHVLETVMEMAGARQVIDDALKTLASTELFGMQGELQEVTERVARIFTNLERNFNQKQKKDMKKRGFTFLEKNQLRQLHQEQGADFCCCTLLDATGMSEDDREDVLETVMEMAGARQVIDDALKTLASTELFGMQGELQEVTERVARIFTNLERNFNQKQKKDMKKRGFTFLEKNQLRQLHQEQGLAKHANDIDFDIHEYGNRTDSEREESLWLRIAEIAANGTKTRSKRQITWLSVLKPTVLSPYMFSPVFGLTVLGPCVLSPSLFSPLLLNPAVLSPYVLSPAVGMPFILSPYLLSPYVLSPLVMAPFILNPYVLSPNVINPYVLSPLILSPTVLCPDVISPMVLGGAILSPGVLSPSVLSKSFLMATVLSPTVLS
ncbi:hypothetical protein ANCCEY_13693 [Ancylostoma ceylanicum]|uniref:YDG domain-containing protein n=1 Tax=Ancylostoma ceylanicum TaxID=53326 RepID=A0A0D6L6D4_9BILA|nr:hypothetical protein ANCCEY_13693 [Ancylostoma ceylanicum]